MTSVKNKNIRRFAEKEYLADSQYAGFRIAVLVIKIIYWVVAAGAIISCLTMMMASLVYMSEHGNSELVGEQAIYNERLRYLIDMTVAVFSLVSCYFLLKFKLSIPLAIASSISCILFFSNFYSVSNINNFNLGASTKFWMMALPTILVALFGIALAVLLIINKRRIAVRCDRIVHELYKAHTKNGEAAISPEEFEKVLDEYKGEEVFPTDKPLKKSQRRRKEKQENKK